MTELMNRLRITNIKKSPCVTDVCDKSIAKPDESKLILFPISATMSKN